MNKLLLFFILVGCVYAQPNNSSGASWSHITAAQLNAITPGAGATPHFTVTNAATPTDCGPTGGGTYKVDCFWDGTAWKTAAGSATPGGAANSIQTNVSGALGGNASDTLDTNGNEVIRGSITTGGAGTASGVWVPKGTTSGQAGLGVNDVAGNMHVGLFPTVAPTVNQVLSVSALNVTCPTAPAYSGLQCDQLTWVNAGSLSIIDAKNQASAVTGNGSTQNLFSSTIPSISAGKCIVVVDTGNWTSNTNGTAVTISYGGQTVNIFGNGTTGLGTNTVYRYSICNNAGVQNAQQVTVDFVVHNVSGSPSWSNPANFTGTMTVNSAVSQTLALTQNGDSSNVFTPVSRVVMGQ